MFHVSCSLKRTTAWYRKEMPCGIFVFIWYHQRLASGAMVMAMILAFTESKVHAAFEALLPYTTGAGSFGSSFIQRRDMCCANQGAMS